MKCYTPEIAWHNRDPVFSVDIQRDPVSKSIYRLASGGADTHIVVRKTLFSSVQSFTFINLYLLQIWFVEYAYENGTKGISNIEAVADLTHHQTAVNVVRFSPSSEFLASGDVGKKSLSNFDVTKFQVIFIFFPRRFCYNYLEEKEQSGYF